MTFENLHQDTTCNCIADAEIDTENEYIRKIGNKKVKISDFLSHWERNKGHQLTECKDICRYKGLSINQCEIESSEEILNRYRTTFKFSPKQGKHYIKFRFTGDAGKVMTSPTRESRSHCTFFKADGFALSKIVISETGNFAEDSK